MLSSLPWDWAEVLALFRTQPSGLTRETCAAGIGKSKGRARQLLEELVTAKILVASQEGREKVYRPAPELADLVSQPVELLDHTADLALVYRS